MAPRGVYLWEVWEEFERIINDRDFPKFKFNIFIQYKRPEYIQSPRGTEYKDWGEPYFRYNILQHQQDILVQLEKNAGENAIVVYASPAFYRIKEPELNKRL